VTSRLHSWTGREFHKRGPAAANVLSPWRLYVRGTVQVLTSADRRDRRALSDTRHPSYSLSSEAVAIPTVAIATFVVPTTAIPTIIIPTTDD